MTLDPKTVQQLLIYQKNEITEYYISIAKEVAFRRRFFEMAGLSLGVALLSFFIGYVVRTFMGVDI